jgi:hypothetical protein
LKTLARKLKKQTKRSVERPIFDAIRKPNAPPGHPLSRAKPEERAHPAERKVKHKHRTDAPDGDE